MASDCYDGCERRVRYEQRMAAKIVSHFGDHGIIVFIVGDAYQHCDWRCISESRLHQCRQGTAAFSVEDDLQGSSSSDTSADLHRPQNLVGGRVDAADRL